MIGIAALFRNEAPYLKEWIEFHRLVGVEKFYLFDNLSTDHFQIVLQPYINQKIVELTSWPIDHSNNQEWNEIQCLAYERILKKVRGKIKWLAILDVDEFLFSPKGEQLGDLLSPFEDVGGIGVNWQAFGTSSIAKIPEDRLLIELLNLKWPENWKPNQHIKSIVRPERVKNYPDPHFGNYKPRFFQVDTAGIPFEGNRSPSIRVDLLRINHYTVRDEFYFKHQKIPRLIKWNEGRVAEIRMEDYTGMIEERVIHRFIPKLKESMRRK